MFTRISFAIALTVAFLASAATALEFERGDGLRPPVDLLAAQAEIVIVGKVTEIENDFVVVTLSPESPKENNRSFKIAVLKIDACILGGHGLTQIRIGFPAEANPDGRAVRGRPLRRRGGPSFPNPHGIALTVGQEGCFFLSPHHEGDFYVMAGTDYSEALDKNYEGYAKQLENIKSLAKSLEDPVVALKATDETERFTFARFLLHRYQRPNATQVRLGGKREAIPAEENKLILDLVAELPWLQDDGSDIPSRSALWALINPSELGYKQPAFPQQQPGAAPINYNKIQDEKSAKFLKDNEGKLRIKRYASGK